MSDQEIVIKHRRSVKREIKPNTDPGMSRMDAFLLETTIWCVIDGFEMTLDVKAYGSTREEVMANLDVLLKLSAERVRNPMIISPRYGQSRILGFRKMYKQVRRRA